MTTKIKSMHLLNANVINNVQKMFRSASNFTLFKNIHHNDEDALKKNHKSVPSCEKNNSSVKPSLKEVDFSDKLIKWAIQNNISYHSFSKLLKVLSEYGIEDLPKNSRALLKAKEEEIKVLTVPPGVYIHFGLERNLTNLILNLITRNLFSRTEVGVSIFIDNLPLSRLTQRGLWVILGSIEGFTNNIFLVGAYHGYSRPKNPNLFLSEFVNEAKTLCAKGLDINGVVYSVTIKRLICDAPAKSFALNIKDFCGYSSCTKCNIVGQYKFKKVCFPEKSTPKTDEDFEKVELYHSAKTNLLEIPNFGVASNVTIDYMHLVCLGVLRKILSIWLSDRKYWICENSASNMIKVLAPLYPCEFMKKPKPFKIFARWTGTEFRQFLLYHGPVVLKKNLKKEHFDLFLLLHVSCRLLCTEASTENIDICRTLLCAFVENYKRLYKTEQITHNFHGLYHLADECVSHGTLDSFSAFPFEKFLLKLRNSLKKSKKKSVPHLILQESSDLIFTKSLAKLPTDHCKVSKRLKVSETELGNFSHFDNLSIKNFEITPSADGDKYVLLKNNKIIEVLNVLEKKEKSNKTHMIAGREFSSVSNFHSEPFDRLDLNMFTVGEPVNYTELWPVDLIDRKCMKIPTESKETVIIALLDENF